MKDDRIVEAYLARNEAAILETQDKYGRCLRNLSYQITADRFTAEECENDTYLQAWNSIPPHEPKTYLFAFLARITRHLSLNCCRNRNRLKRQAFLYEFSAEIEQCIPAPDDTSCRLDDIAFAEMINRFLGTLNAKKRNVFLRRYWYFDTIPAIAERYQMGQSAVKTMLLRTRRQLHDFLEQEGYHL